jgi:hypothetical protein
MAVNEREAMDEHTMKFGLLMESAQAHQKLAEAHLEKLRAHTQDLDGVVRDEIRRTLVDELQEVTAESDRAARALRAMKHAVHMRGLVWNIGIAFICAVVPTTVAHYVLPTPAEISALRVQRDALAQNVASLEQRGGKIDWKNCGDPARLCVRIDRKAPVYGEKADYFVAKGY